MSRYSTEHTDDGLPGDEGQFLACSFWLVGALALSGRVDEARELYERLLGLRNDLGLLSEEYDVKLRRQVGNFPQAFSHLALDQRRHRASVRRARRGAPVGAPAQPSVNLASRQRRSNGSRQRFGAISSRIGPGPQEPGA